MAGHAKQRRKSHAYPENFVRNGTAIGKVDDYSAPFIAQEAATWLKTKRDLAKPFILAVWTHDWNPTRRVKKPQPVPAG